MQHQMVTTQARPSRAQPLPWLLTVVKPEARGVRLRQGERPWALPTSRSREADSSAWKVGPRR